MADLTSTEWHNLTFRSDISQNVDKNRVWFLRNQNHYFTISDVNYDMLILIVIFDNNFIL